MSKMSTDKATADASKDISAIFKSPKPIAIAKIRKDFLTDPGFDMNHMRNTDMVVYKLKSYLTEIRAFVNPPRDIKMVMDAICILFGIAPSWKASKKFLADAKVLEKLMTYDKDNIDPIAIAKIRKDFITDPMFNVECMNKKSLAAGTLCAWVIAIEAYDRKVKGSGGTVEESK